jgi:hypothetical protein
MSWLQQRNGEIFKIWAEYKGKPRKEAVANFRLKTGHECLAVHLRKIGIYESNKCTVCQMQNSTVDEEHLLFCPKLDTEQQVPKNTIKHYWDARVMINFPPSAVGTTAILTLNLPALGQARIHWVFLRYSQ